MREQPRSTPSTFLEYKSVLITVVTVCVCLVVQPCLTLCDPVVCSPPGSSVHGILQARVWSGVPFPSPGDLPNPGIEPGLLHCGQILYHLSHQGNPFLKSLLRLLQYCFCCFMFLFFFFGHEASGVLVPQPGIELSPPALALAIAWPGKSL